MLWKETAPAPRATWRPPCGGGTEVRGSLRGEETVWQRLEKGREQPGGPQAEGDGGIHTQESSLRGCSREGGKTKEPGMSEGDEEGVASEKEQ